MVAVDLSGWTWYSLHMTTNETITWSFYYMDEHDVLWEEPSFTAPTAQELHQTVIDSDEQKFVASQFGPQHVELIWADDFKSFTARTVSRDGYYEILGKGIQTRS